MQYIKRDKWLEEIINRPVYKLSLNEKILMELQNKSSIEFKNFNEKIRLKNVFIYSKIKTSEINKINFLQNSHFFIVDTNVIFEKEINFKNNYNVDFNIRFSNETDREGVIDVSRKSFSFSRFHLDEKISKKIANEIKAKWVENYFNGKRGDILIVASFKKKIIGFLLLIKKENTLIIDLIAIDSEYRGKKIGSNMIYFAEKNIKNIDKVIVGTQIANIPSIRFYEKNYFRIVESYYVLHYHNL